MSVVCNLTTIPSRFGKIQHVIDTLSNYGIFDQIVVHVPKKYKRFDIPCDPPKLTNCLVNLVDVDYGPATRIVYAIGDTVVWCDDDTEYPEKEVRFLIRQHHATKAVCGGSGFSFHNYFKGDFSKTPFMPVQVLEGYGMVVCSKTQLDTVRAEIPKFTEMTLNDDLIFGNVTEKHSIKKLCFPWDIKQYDYGFGKDALHYNDGDGTHVHRNKTILQSFRMSGHMYFKPYVSFAIGVCNEHIELENLLYCLSGTMFHCDEVVVLVDTNKSVPEVYKVLERYPWVKVYERGFTGNFAEHKNHLTSLCSGEYVFNIDADEIPNSGIIENIYTITQADLIYVPRVNLIPGATREFLKECKFNVSPEGFINWPDYQGRIYKQNLTWVGDVHEKIQGHKTSGQLPPQAHAALWHIKSVQKMKTQAEYYKSLGY